LENELFGWDHAQAAAALCRNWRLPEEFAILIERHPNVDELLNGSNARTDAACVAIASLLPSCRDDCWEERDQFIDALDKITGEILVDLDEMMKSVDESFAEFAPLMKLAVPERTLTDWINLEELPA
jgi:HD-like signal output (HDOD) protein